MNGTDLIRRVDGGEGFGLTTPLITRADGSKMGKTAAGAVWLNEDMLPAFEYWQFWRNTDDRDVTRFLKLFTDLTLEEIAAADAGDVNAAKVLLATEATALCRGRAAAAAAAATAAATFGGGGAGENLPKFAVSGPVTILEALVGLGFAASKGEARRLVGGGGARVDGEVVGDEGVLVGAGAKVSAGKKRHGVLVGE